MRILTLIFLFLLAPAMKAQVSFHDYFTEKVLRFDFMFAGNSSETTVYPVGLKEEPYWAGSHINLTDTFNLGNFKYEVFDLSSGQLIYSRGFCTLFQEWQTTSEAGSMDRIFYEVVTMPYPKNSIRFLISIRERDGSFNELYETTIDPDDYFIRKENPVKAKATMLAGGGDPQTCVDLAFIAEGYKEDEMDKFRHNVRVLTDTLFSEPPFNEYRDRFNIWAVEAVSQDSGTDIPGERVYNNTALNSSFFTFDIDRYLTTLDLKSVNDYAALAPHDNIIIVVNSDKYGGGGVYNYYSCTSAGHTLSPRVFVHEFGHAFAGLADEYYTSEVAYNEFYPLDVEPWEPNITTLVDFDSKWKKLISSDTPVPTPAEEMYRNTTGLFEGAGYSAKGIYRAEMECRMKSNDAEGFCTVCRKAIEEMIEYYIR